MAQTFEEGNKSPHSSLWKEMPSSGEGGEEGTVWGGLEPRASPASPGQPPAPPLTPPPQGCAAPRPWPLARPSRPPALGPEVRGRPPLVVCLEGKGGKERGEAQSGPGGGPDRELHHSCLSVPALSRPPGKPHRSSLDCPNGAGRKGGRWDFFFFFFLFGNKKFLGLGEILCATAVPRGSPAPPTPPSPSFASCGGEGGRGTFRARVNVGGKGPSPAPPNMEEKNQEGREGRSASRGRRGNPRPQSGPGGWEPGPSSSVRPARLQRPPLPAAR